MLRFARHWNGHIGQVTDGRRIATLAVRFGLVLGAILGTLVLTEATVPSTATAAPSVTTTWTPGDQFQDMVVDASTGRVFASFSDSNTIAVFDMNGNLVSTITGEAGAGALVALGSALYVANYNAGTIDEFNTTSLQKVTTVTSGLVQPLDLVYAAGSFWTESGTSLAQVNPGTGQITLWPQWDQLGRLVADPAHADEMITFAPSQSPVQMGIVDLTTGTPTLTVNQNEGSAVPAGIANVRDAAVSPDGTHTVPAGGAPYEFVELNTSTMQPSGVIYPANPYPTAVAMTAAAGGLFAGGLNGLYWPDVVVYPLDNPADLLASYDFGTNGETTLPRGLAFSPDASKLFIVTGGNGSRPDDEFHVMTLAGSLPPPPVPVLSASQSSAMSFGNVRLGNAGGPLSLTITNTGAAPDVVNQVVLGGTDPQDFIGSTDCASTGGTVTVAPGSSCTVAMSFFPSKPGPRSATLQFEDNEASPLTLTLTGTGTEGYYEVGADGHVYNYGDAIHYGDPSHLGLAAHIVSMVATPDGNGYWLLGSDGGVFSYGDAGFYGSTGAMHLNQPVVGMASTADGGGYWSVARDGGIFAFGDAPFYGSMGGVHLNQPVVGMAPTPDGGGYWLVASDGGIFAFGDAAFYGSTGGIRLNQPVVGMSPTPDGGGYWLVASDGGIFAFGDAAFYGSTGAIHLNRPVVDMAPSPSGAGYWLVASDGGIFAYGDSPFMGSTGGSGVSDVVALAPTAGATLQGILGIRARQPAGRLHADVRPSIPAAPPPSGWASISS